MRMIVTLPRRSIPVAPSRPNSARNAAPTTTVGSTNGTVRIARNSRRPGKRYRPSTYAAGRPRTTVRTVETTACQSVNQATPRVAGLVTASRNELAPVPPSPVASTVTSGYTKKKPRKSSGRPSPTAAAIRRITGTRPSTPRSTGRGWLRFATDRGSRRSVARRRCRRTRRGAWPTSPPGRRTC